MDPLNNDSLHDAYERLLERVSSGETGAGFEGPSSAPAGSEGDGPLPQLQSVFGPYRLVRPLGHGGQGVVYLAQDTRLARDVALKLLSAGGSALPTARARFEREATAASRLRHPGICTVFEAGELDGQRFLAMEFVDGESLPAWVARTMSNRVGSESGTARQRVDEALGLVEQVARAVQAAHDAGVVHRDLKPANVMLRRDGTPVVLDFGLAGDDSEQGGVLTLQGDVLGTPAYMPPERVRGAVSVGAPADPREDVYGLGAILFECLTGERPFRGHTREQLYRSILSDPVSDPRLVDRSIPREARFVVETALEKTPDRRYGSAAEFADDVQRLRRREPICARPVPVWLRLQRWVQRHPGAALPMIAAILALTAGIVVAVLLLGELGTEARHARIRALLGESSVELRRDPQRALLLAKEAHGQLDDAVPAELSTAVRSKLVEVIAATRRLRDLDHGSFQKRAGFSADGSRVATLCLGVSYEGVPQPQLRFWDVASGSSLADFAVRGERASRFLSSVAFDRVGDRVMFCTQGGETRVFSFADVSLQHLLVPSESAGNEDREPAPMGSGMNELGSWSRELCCFVPGRADHVLTGSRDGARLWRLTPGSGEVVWHDARPDWWAEGGLCHLAVSADGTLCAAAERDGSVRLLRATDGVLLAQSPPAATGVQPSLAFDPSRPLLLANATAGNDVIVWRTDEWKEGAEGQPAELVVAGQLSVEGKVARLLRVAPSRQDRRDVFAVCDTDRSVRLYRSVDTAPFFELVATVRAHVSDVSCLSFAPDGSRFVTGGHDANAYIFDLEGRKLDELLGGNSVVVAADWSPSGDRIVTSHSFGTAHVWRVRDPAFRTEHAPRAVPRLVAAGPSVVAGLRDGSCLVLDLEGRRRHHILGSGRIGGAGALALRDDGLRLAVRGPGTVKLWDLSGDEPRLENPISGRWGEKIRDGYSVDFARDGTLYVGERGEIRALRENGQVETVAELRHEVSLVHAGGGVVATKFRLGMWDCEQGVDDDLGLLKTPNESNVLVSSRDRQTIALLVPSSGEIRILDAVARREVQRLVVPQTLAVALSSNGDRLVTVGSKGRAALWDLAAEPPSLVVELRGHRGVVRTAVFSPDDRQIITGGSDGSIRFWPSSYDDLEAMAAARAVRD